MEFHFLALTRKFNYHTAIYFILRVTFSDCNIVIVMILQSSLLTNFERIEAC